MAQRAQGRKPARAERSPFLPWLLLAAGAHAGLLLAVLFFGAGAPRHEAELQVADAASDPIWLELVPRDSPAPAGTAVAPRGSASPPSHAVVGHEPSSPSAPPAGAPGALRNAGMVEPTPAAATPRKSPRPEPASRASVAAASGSLDGPSAGEEGATEPEGTGRKLSLRDLGIDRGSNPFIGSVTDLPTERQLLNRRLRQSLRGEIARQDQTRGLGPEGPAVRAVTDIVMASAAAPNTTALLRVRTDGAGAVTLVDVLEADRDADEWRRIAAELVRVLAGTRLRVPAGSNGVGFQLRVVSRVQLPSGADPGLSIDVLGIPLKKGDGERSSKLSILSPVIREVEVPDSNGTRVPVVSFSLIGGMGDLADIGAVARRLVTAYLVAMDTDFSPAEAPAPAVQPAAPPVSAPAP